MLYRQRNLKINGLVIILCTLFPIYSHELGKWPLFSAGTDVRPCVGNMTLKTPNYKNKMFTNCQEKILFTADHNLCCVYIWKCLWLLFRRPLLNLTTLKKAFYGISLSFLQFFSFICIWLAMKYESTFNIVCGITSNTNLNNVDLIHDLGWKLDNLFVLGQEVIYTTSIPLSRYRYKTSSWYLPVNLFTYQITKLLGDITPPPPPLL